METRYTWREIDRLYYEQSKKAAAVKRQVLTRKNK